MLNEAIDASVRWLTSSDLRIREQSSALSGAYCSSYDMRNKAYQLVYCEITAYGIQFLLRANKWEGNRDFLTIARASGEFLLRAQYKNCDKIMGGAFPYGYRLPNEERIEKYFSFDTAVCIGALTELYKSLSDKRYLEAAIKGGTWLEGMQCDDGSFKAGEFVERVSVGSSGWYGDRGCLHAKNAIGFLKLYQATKDKHFLLLAKKTLDWVLSLQHVDGYFRATRDLHYVFTHAHCYTLEGLLYGYLILGEQRHLDAAVRGGQWLMSAQNSDGSLYQYYGPDIDSYLDSVGSRLRTIRKFIRPRETGATAQAMRIWMALYHETEDEAFHLASRKSARFLVAMQSQGRVDPNCLGGFHASCDYFLGFRRSNSKFYAWTSMFACHALMILSRKSEYESFQSIVSELF